jgi:transposase-like protein
METKKESKREKWIRLMRDYERSGKRIREWCAQAGCSHRSFEYWRYKVRIHETYKDLPDTPETAPGWIKAECPATPSDPNVSLSRASESGAEPCAADSLCDFGGVSIHIGRIRVNVTHGFAHALLHEVAEALS